MTLWRRRTTEAWLPAIPASAATTRRIIRQRTMLFGVPHLYDTAALCADELVINVMKHVKWPSGVAETFGLSVSVYGPFFIVIVSDPDPTLPVVGGPVEWDAYDWSPEKAKNNNAPQSGMGLITVTDLCKDEGGHFDFRPSEEHGGKIVFFGLPIRRGWSW